MARKGAVVVGVEQWPWQAVGDGGQHPGEGIFLLVARVHARRWLHTLAHALDALSSAGGTARYVPSYFRCPSLLTQDPLHYSDSHSRWAVAGGVG